MRKKVSGKAIEVIHTTDLEIEIAKKYVWFLNEPNYTFDNVTNDSVIRHVESLHNDAIERDLKLQEKSNTIREVSLQTSKSQAILRDVLLDPILSTHLNATVLYVPQITIKTLLHQLERSSQPKQPSQIDYDLLAAVSKHGRPERFVKLNDDIPDFIIGAKVEDEQAVDIDVIEDVDVEVDVEDDTDSEDYSDDYFIDPCSPSVIKFCFNDKVYIISPLSRIRLSIVRDKFKVKDKTKNKEVIRVREEIKTRDSILLEQCLATQNFYYSALVYNENDLGFLFGIDVNSKSYVERAKNFIRNDYGEVIAFSDYDSDIVLAATKKLYEQLLV